MVILSSLLEKLCVYPMAKPQNTLCWDTLCFTAISIAVVWQHFQRVRGYHTYPLLYPASSFPLFPWIPLLSLRTPRLWQAWQGNLVLSSVTQGQRTASWSCMFCWKNPCPFSRNTVRTFQSFVSLCCINYCLTSRVFCYKDGQRIIMMSSLLPVTSITPWQSLCQENVINSWGAFLITKWGMVGVLQINL